jgi:hypothetical protein
MVPPIGTHLSGGFGNSQPPLLNFNDPHYILGGPYLYGIPLTIVPYRSSF